VPSGGCCSDASIFGVAGIALLIIGYYIWELVTPYNLRRELQENKNLAVAVVVAAFILGMAIVIAAALILHKIAAPARARQLPNSSAFLRSCGVGPLDPRVWTDRVRWFRVSSDRCTN
jgi:uncharacterized membrane protein